MTPNLRRSLAVLALAALVAFASGCSAIKKAKKAAAKAAGVKVTTQTVKPADLNQDFQTLQGTEWDFFAESAAKPVKVQYKKFTVSSLDAYLAETAELYASYLVLSALVDKSQNDLNTFVGSDIYSTDQKMVTKALKKKSPDELKVVERLKALKSTVELLSKQAAAIPEKATGVKDKGTEMSSKISSDFAKDPKKALVADEAVEQVKTSIERMTEVINGTPGLVQKMTRMTEVMGWIGV